MPKRSPLFLGFLIITAVIVVGLVSWSASRVNTTETTNNNANQNSNESADQTSADSVTKLGGGVSLLKEATNTTVGSISTYRFEGTNTINVMPEAMQSAVLAETPVTKEEAIQVGGTEGKKLTITSAKDGSLGTVVQVVRDGKLYDFRGSDAFLTSLDEYIKFKSN